MLDRQTDNVQTTPSVPVKIVQTVKGRASEENEDGSGGRSRKRAEDEEVEAGESIDEEDVCRLGHLRTGPVIGAADTERRIMLGGTTKQTDVMQATIERHASRTSDANTRYNFQTVKARRPCTVLYLFYLLHH